MSDSKNEISQKRLFEQIEAKIDKGFL